MVEIDGTETIAALKQRVRFRFGFACYPDVTPVVIQAVEGWSTLRIHGYVVHTHPEATTRVLQSINGTVVFIGDVFVAHGTASLDETAAAILADDWNALDILSGRFALLTFSKGGLRVFNDPFGARTIYYKLSGPVAVASHAALVAELTGESLSPAIRKYVGTAEYLAKRTRFLPGDYTMYSNILRLAPNNYYDMGNRSTHRYWPREDLPDTTLNDFHDLTDEYFANYAKFLSHRYTPVIGLTGGVDSRAVIAGLRAYGLRPRLTTWTSLAEEETARVGGMVDHLGLMHSFIDVRYKSEDAVFVTMREASDVNLGYWRGGSYLTAQSAIGASTKDVFIRGLGGEILRGSYHSSQITQKGDWLDVFVKLYMTKVNKNPSTEYLTFTKRAFDQFMSRANYRGDLFNADPGDLIYWEQRMGMWAAALHNELDAAMSSHTGFNSRPLYAAAWGLPAEQRFGKQLVGGIIGRYDKMFMSL